MCLDSKTLLVFLKFCVVVFAGFLLMSCSHWRDRYFDAAVDEQTQFEVREKFGKPHIVEHSLLDKNTTWVYRVAIPEGELDPSGLKGLGSGVAEVGEAVASLVGKGDQSGAPRERIVCLRYELLFDEERILRKWTRKFCQLKKVQDPFESQQGP